MAPRISDAAVSSSPNRVQSLVSTLRAASDWVLLYPHRMKIATDSYEVRRGNRPLFPAGGFCRRDGKFGGAGCTPACNFRASLRLG